MEFIHKKISIIWAFIFNYLERVLTFYNRYYFVKKYWCEIGNNWDEYLIKYPFLNNLDKKLNYLINSNKIDDNLQIKNIKIITWNLHNGYDFWNNYTFLDQMEWLNKQNADIICLQEVPNHMGIYVKNIPVHYIKAQDILSKSLKMHYIIDHISNTMILSKYHVKKINKINQFLNCYTYGNHMNTYSIKINIENKYKRKNKDIEKYKDSNINKNIKELIINNIHLTNDITFYEQSIFFKCYIDNNKYNKLKTLDNRYININDNDKLILFCGDFNGYKNNFIKKFHNLYNLKSYPIIPFNIFPFKYFKPLINIDYIYHYNNKFYDNTILNIHKITYSDHYPLSCIIKNI